MTKSSSIDKKIVTYALPYANGMLHLGHVMGMIQADCYVRSLRLLGKQVTFVCGDDAHGTPIMLNAQKQKVTPDALVAEFLQEHIQDVNAFNISFDGYHTTHCSLNTEIVHEVYHRLQEKEVIVKKQIEQAYDETAQMFLPDRYIKGTCPKCGAIDQYGDHCEVCGKTYNIKELIDPKSTMTNSDPVWRLSSHDFFQLSTEQSYVSSWLGEVKIQEAVKNKLSEWFVDGLQDWDITRDAPYFGIEIPNQKDKYFYVWLDAPFGYMSSLGKTLSLATAEAVFEEWNHSQIEHFIGKDIVCFHGVFWPAVLNKAGLKVPDRLHVHGFLTLSGAKMSKSRGTFLTARAYLSKLSPDLVRYYFASRLSHSVSDVDLDWVDFVQKINSDLVGKLANIGSRCQGFVHKHQSSQLTQKIDQMFWDKIVSHHSEIAASYEAVNLAQTCRLIMMLCDETNHYIAEKKPWALAKEGRFEELELCVNTAMNVFRYLVYWLSPITPGLAQTVALAMGDSSPVLISEPLLDKTIEPFSHLISRLTTDQVQF